MVAWSSPRVSLGGGRATGSLEGKSVWAGERSDLQDEIKRRKEKMLSCPAKGYQDSRAKGSLNLKVPGIRKQVELGFCE